MATTSLPLIEWSRRFMISSTGPDESKVTKPNPRERCVLWSSMICDSEIVPYVLKYDLKSSSSTDGERPASGCMDKTRVPPSLLLCTKPQRGDGCWLRDATTQTREGKNQDATLTTHLRGILPPTKIFETLNPLPPLPPPDAPLST